MPRAARKRAESGIYHTMLRGIDRQLIFEDSEDYLRFISILQECREECGFKLYAYCLMGNHVHILLKVEEDSLQDRGRFSVLGHNPQPLTPQHTPPGTEKFHFELTFMPFVAAF